MSRSFRHRVRQWLRGRSLLWRRPARRARTAVSIAKYRVRRALGRTDPARVVPGEVNDEKTSLNHPLIGVVPGPGVKPEALGEQLTRQTESSWSMDSDAVRETPFLWLPGQATEHLEATHLEAMLLTAVAHDLEVTVAGWSSPAAEPMRPINTDQTDFTLLRRPQSSDNLVPGRIVPHIGGGIHDVSVRPSGHSSGPWLLDHRGLPGAVLPLPCRAVDRRLAMLPDEPGPRTVLFLLPFLAVGGAERLLFDLLAGLGPRYRCLVVTLEPHRPELGSTVDVCRRLTPHIYTLGDWMERESRWSALRHLIRRWRVECLVSWNGTVDFYDHAAALGADLPDLRILAQLYNHEGGWIEHLSDGLIARADGHLAVNDRIASALSERNVPIDKVHTVHHGVEVPEPAESDARTRARRQRRLELGLPEDAFVVGTFVRMHRQKRPLDVIRLARRLADRDIWFLLVGGGPMDREIDREISSDPPPNLVRLPMQSDARPLFDAIDLCLMTSEYEGLPVFLLEGLAREIPCVTTDTGEVSELLANGGGTLVQKPGDLARLERGILELLDDQTRFREGRLGRQTVVERFSLEHFVGTYEGLIFP